MLRRRALVLWLVAAIALTGALVAWVPVDPERSMEPVEKFLG
jgi:hypothetical protein